ncbi:MAG: FTR1 family protein [Alphaproteobacteria bacterium]|nr:FTR1 family protein [Alphaproteobacteria bacterium]
MLASLIIVFREVIEAGLIVGIVLAATKEVPARGRWVAGGVGAGVLGACIVAAFAGQIANLFSGAGQEIFNASVLLLAVVMLAWHNIWMSRHGRELAKHVKNIGAAVTAGERPLFAMAVVVAAAILREGSEVVLFLYGIVQGTTAASLLTGGMLGLAGGVVISALMYLGLLAIPAGRLFRTTSWLITLLAAGMAAQAVLFVQNAGFLNVLTRPLWDTSWLLPDGGEGWRGIVGKMLHTLIGYTAAPDGAQLAAYSCTIAAILVLMRMERRWRSNGQLVPKAA